MGILTSHSRSFTPCALVKFSMKTKSVLNGARGIHPKNKLSYDLDMGLECRGLPVFGRDVVQLMKLERFLFTS